MKKPLKQIFKKLKPVNVRAMLSMPKNWLHIIGVSLFLLSLYALAFNQLPGANNKIELSGNGQGDPVSITITGNEFKIELQDIYGGIDESVFNDPAKANQYIEAISYRAKKKSINTVNNKKVAINNINTDIVYVDDSNLEFNKASIEIKKQDNDKQINTILYCNDNDFNKKTGECSNWQMSDIKPENKEDHISFSAYHFSAYVGAYLEIIDVQPNLTKGDVWEVRFQTQGRSDLEIEAVDGTLFDIDIGFIGLYCGEKQILSNDIIWQNQKLTVENYACDNEISRVRNQTITAGRHWLSFSFGYTQNVLAHNFACDSGTLDSTCYVNSQQVMGNGDTITGTGTIIIQSGGDLTATIGNVFNISMGNDITVENGGQISGNVRATSTNFTLDSGGLITVVSKGYNYGDVFGGDGYGPGGGGGGPTFSGYSAAGGGYGGDGGDASYIRLGGDGGYGSITEPVSLGSGGGTSYNSVGGAGGGGVKLIATNTAEINGSIYANGGNGIFDSSSSGGGGAGGSIYISTVTMTGTGTISAVGGNGGNGNTTTRDGGGGGGRIAVYYTNNSSTINYNAISGTGHEYGEKGGAGTIYFKNNSSGENILTVSNGSYDGTYTRQPAASYTFGTTTIHNYGKYIIPSGATMAVENSLIIGSSANTITVSGGGTLTLNCTSANIANFTVSNSGTINIGASDITFSSCSLTNSNTVNNNSSSTTFSSCAITNNSTFNNSTTDVAVYGGTFTNNSTMTGLKSLTLDNSAVFNQNGQFTVSEPDLTIGTSSTFTFQNIASSSAVSLGNVFIGNGSAMTHSANSSSHNYSLNLNLSGNLTVDSSGSINLNGKGYSGGYGPGAGTDEGVYGSGAGHGGVGGATADAGSSGGPVYGSTTTPVNIGSGGGDDGGVTGGPSGGGAIKIVSGGMIDIDGSISADGNDAANTNGGGASGGSVWLVCDTLTGSGTISAAGGEPQTANAGGGGGGRIALDYNTNNAVLLFNVDGGGSTYPGADGTIYPEACPTISTQAATDVIVTTVTGHGSIDSLGINSITEHGHIWDTSNDMAILTMDIPVSQWKMNDNVANTTVVDSVGSNDGTAQQNTSALASTTAKLNGALEFNSSSDYINISDGSSLDFTDSDFTIMAWVYPNSNDAGIIYDNRYDIASNDEGWLFGLYSSGQLVFDANSGASDNDTDRSISDVYAANKWQLVGAVKNGTTVYYYVDGEQVDSDTTVGTIAYTGTVTHHLIGKVGGGYYNHSYNIPNQYFNGTMDDLRIYDYALTEDEIAQLYNSGNGTELTTTSPYSQLGVKSSTGSFTSPLTGLSPSTTYYYRAYAELTDGSIIYGNIESFETLSGTPVTTIAFPPNDSYQTSVNSIYGANNPVYGDSQAVEISIKDQADGNKWWSGSDWSADIETWLPVTGTSTWTYDSSGISWASNRQYLIRASSTNTLGIAEEPRAGNSFIFSNSIPKYRFNPGGYYKMKGYLKFY